MSPKRAQSLPPRLEIRSNQARDCRIAKPWKSLFQGGAAGRKNLSPKPVIEQPTVLAGSPLTIRFQIGPDGSLALCGDPLSGGQIRSSIIVDSLEQLGNIIEAKIRGCLPRTEEEDHILALPTNTGNFVNNARSTERSPHSFAECSCSCHHCLAARPTEPRQIILDRAARDRPYKGKPSSMPRLLAGYGRKEYQLRGQSAVSRIVDGESRCEYCKIKKTKCIIVDRDEFWKRNQCVACVQRKGKCSLELAIRKADRSKT